MPTSLIWAGGSGGGKSGDSPLSPEHEMTRWMKIGLIPRLTRIESAIYSDPDFFGATARDYPQFDTSRSIRGDAATEALIMHNRVQDGTVLVDEARAELGLPELPNGAGKIPVINPAGAGATPAQFLPSNTDTTQ